MKKLLVPGVIACLLLIQISSCKKIIETVFQGMDVNVPEVQITIPSVIAVTPNEIALGSFSYQLNLDSIIKANTAGVFGINAVSSVKVKQVTINLSNADQLNNLSNFESFRMTVQSNANSSPSELFTANFTDTYASSITITPVNSPDLLTYLKGSEISYNMYGKMRRITAKPLNMTIAVTLRVN
jgi:hypothetical protein